MFMLGSIIIPWLGPAARRARKAESRCDHRLQKLFEAANVDFGLVCSLYARANQVAQWP